MLSVIGCGVVPIVSGIICNLLYSVDAELLSAALTFLAMGCLTVLLISSWDPPTAEGEIRNNPSSTYKFFRFLTAYYYMVTDPKPAAMLCDPPYSGTTAASTDYEKTK